MHHDHPLISVIIPVYNCERYLGDAIESVLRQWYRPVEIIVIDDGSTDRSGEVARRFSEQVRYCRLPHGGAGDARNAGSDLAAGELLAFIDADDLWVEDKLTRQVAALRADRSLEAVFGHVRQFISPELPEALKRRLRCSSDALPGRVPGAMLITRRGFFRVGYFSRSFGEVVDWASRADEMRLQTAMLGEVVLQRRLHAANTASFRANRSAEYARLLKRALDRRRSGSAG